MSKEAVRTKTAAMFETDLECMPRAQLQALQFERLQRTLQRAYDKVAHFRKKFDAAGVARPT